MTIHTIESTVVSSAVFGLDESVRPDGAHLPVSAWSLHTRVQPNARAVVEITDELGDLAGLVTSNSLGVVSVDWAWRGRGLDTDGQPQWWALAVGHASTSDDEPTVTFTRRIGRRSQRRTVLRPTLFHGLWVAAVAGLRTAVSYQQGPDYRIRRLAPTRSVTR